MAPIGWITAAAMTGIPASVYYGAEPWIKVCAVVMAGVCLLYYFAFYGYFAFTNPDALCSEKFTLTKLAIEHSAKGDDLTGLLEEQPERPRLPPPAVIQGGK